MKKPRVYPDDPSEHIMHVRKKKNRIIIDENYKYESRNPFYRLYCGMIWLLAKLLVPILAKIWTNSKVKGRKNLKGLKGQPVIFVANHVHALDAPVICTKTLRRKKIRIVSLSENASIPVAGHLLRCMGLVPLGDTYGGMRNFNNYVNKLIDKKKCILFFPEASLWTDYEGLRPFHKGAFIFAVKRQVPVVPMVYTFQKKRHRRTRMVLNIGKPIMPENMNVEQFAEKTYDYFEQCLTEIYGRPVIKPSSATNIKVA